MKRSRVSSSCVGVIPARFASTRFPGKPLALLLGKPLVQHVYERASRARSLSKVLVATDDEKIAGVVEGFGGEAILTRKDHRNGTERMAEVAGRFGDRFFVNIQGDEPMIEPDEIDLCAGSLVEAEDCPVFTLACPIGKREDMENPNVVKVVTSLDGFALYFSRSPIPWGASGAGADGAAGFRCLRHIGIYACRRKALLDFSGAGSTPLEISEGLEQLRFLERGHKIGVRTTSYQGRGVDTREDLAALEELLSVDR